MPRVMISYRNVDGQKEFAIELEKTLSDAGIETWIDVNDIPRLSRWEDEIFKGIIDSDYVLLCMSPEYFESETCLLECYVARGYGKTILPIILPFEGNDHVLDLIPKFEETRGLEFLHYLNIEWGKVLGLEEDLETMKQRIVRRILTPTALDIEYDVYFSFKWEHAEFATRISDDLNAAGIKAFIHTRSIDIGVDWRHASWNATLRASFHAVILSTQVADSQYISKEVLVSRTKDTIFIPILTTQYVNDDVAKKAIRQSFAKNKNLSILNDIQWIIPDKGYDIFIQELVKDIKILLEREK